MSAVKFLLNILGLILFLPLLVYDWLRGKPKQTKSKKPKHPVKTFPKYAKNKRYLPENYISPWTRNSNKNSNKWKPKNVKDLKTSKPRNLPMEKSA